MIKKMTFVIASMALSGCGASAPAPKASPSEIFGLRTECGKMGEAWLARHPVRKFSDYSKNEEAKIFYNSEINRCWIVVTYRNWQYHIVAGQSPRSWPAWAAHKIWKEVTEESQTLYDVQTGADVKSCRLVDYSTYDDDCRYIRKAAESDL